MRSAPRPADFGVTSIDIAVLILVVVAVGVVTELLASLRRFGRGGTL